MRKLFFFALVVAAFVAASCERTYRYVEHKEGNIDGVIDRYDRDEVTFTAKSDTDAYMKAFDKFVLSQQASVMIAQTTSGPTYEPTSFSLYNPEGVDISNIQFATREEYERQIVSIWFGDSKEEREALEEIDVDELLKSFDVVKDEFDVKGVTWYRPKSKPKNLWQNAIYVYFGKKGNELSPLILSVQYTAKSWLFIRKINFSIDGDAYEFVPQNMKTDNGSGRIWEWCHEYLNRRSDMEMVKALSKAKEAKMKLDGTKYYEIKDITPKQIEDIKKTVDLYRAMGGKL